MIPKVIHYCWFGNNPLPDEAKKCIESWRRFFPDYEIKEWNESNFDMASCDYIKEAYTYKKWAFISDYARFKILYSEGGIYFDTDVEVIKSFDEILKYGGFMGQEATSSLNISVNPGLGIATEPGIDLYKEILDYYEKIHFVKENGDIDTSITICDHVTKILLKNGYDDTKEMIQEVAGITIYPPEYFCPQNYISGNIMITENTRSIHHYTATWHSKWDNLIIRIEKSDKKRGIGYKLRRIVSFPFRCINKIDRIGFRKTLSVVQRKILDKIRCV